MFEIKFKLKICPVGGKGFKHLIDEREAVVLCIGVGKNLDGLRE